jgi:hypothetical protein
VPSYWRYGLLRELFLLSIFFVFFYLFVTHLQLSEPRVLSLSLARGIRALYVYLNQEVLGWINPDNIFIPEEGGLVAVGLDPADEKEVDEDEVLGYNRCCTEG